MFEERTLVYFNPFYFKDGSTASPKYFLTLKNIDGKTVIANLPSSQMYVPYHETNKKHGCIDLPELSFCCYCFEMNTPVTDNQWSFPLDTFIYGKWVEDYELSVLEETYRIQGVDYEVCGKITNEEYRKVLNCLSKAHNVKRKFKKMIEGW